MDNPFLVGKSVYLRPLEREDAVLVQPWLNDPHVSRTLRTHGPLSRRAEEAYIERISQGGQDVVAVIVRQDVDKAIGVTGLHAIDREARHALFGITIGDRDAWGLGFGTEATFLFVGFAFEMLNLNRLMLHAYEFNHGGLRVYEKVGFRQEGILRQDVYREGRYWNTVVMGLLREEWPDVKARLTPLLS